MKNSVKKPSWWDEFAAFAIKGNAMALAVGTIIGAAFSTITKSLTDDIIMPIVSIFLGKLLYFLTMVCGVGLLYERAPAGLSFLHILFFLTLIGSYMNTSIFNPSRDKYYAVILLRMNARSYTLSNYGYALGKVVVGFLPFTILFGLDRGVPLWL